MEGAGAEALGPAINGRQAGLESRNGTYKSFDGADRPVALHVAKTAFGQRGLTLQPDYLNVLASRFGAGRGPRAPGARWGPGRTGSGGP